jgi:hypothetical protein
VADGSAPVLYDSTGLLVSLANFLFQPVYFPYFLTFAGAKNLYALHLPARILMH